MAFWSFWARAGSFGECLVLDFQIEGSRAIIDACRPSTGRIVCDCEHASAGNGAADLGDVFLDAEGKSRESKIVLTQFLTSPGLVVVGNLYGCYTACEALRSEWRLTVVDFMIFILLVAFYGPLLGIRSL